MALNFTSVTPLWHLNLIKCVAGWCPPRILFSIWPNVLVMSSFLYNASFYSSFIRLMEEFWFFVWAGRKWPWNLWIRTNNWSHRSAHSSTCMQVPLRVKIIWFYILIASECTILSYGGVITGHKGYWHQD